MIHLHVWFRTPHGQVLQAGELRVADPDPRRGGRLHGEFRYHPDYVDHPTVPALDPVHLPRELGVFNADRPHAGIHGVFEDSLPDDWGRGLLIRCHRLPREQQSAPHLLTRLGPNGLGALIYTAEASPPSCDPDPAKSPRDTAALIEAAERYEQNPSTLANEELRALFRAASSPGGARPKLVVDHRGRSCIAKLGSARDQVDLVRIEAACLSLATDAGLRVPDHAVATFGSRAALLIARFDLHAEGGSNHYISMQSLLGAEGFYQVGYEDLADVVRRVSGRPEQDLPDLYRQAVFNAVLGNTDDHLKNFAMLHDGAAWRLTPAYDLTPDVPQRGEHVLHFGHHGNRPSPEALAWLAGAFGFSKQRGLRIRREVCDAVADWRARFDEQEIGSADCSRVGRDIQARLRALR